ncbi:MAG: GH25 family lysozyme [Sphingomonas sp.]
MRQDHIKKRGVRSLQLGAGIAAAVLLAGGLWVFATGWHPSPASFPFQGVDVSAEQGSIEWPVLRAGGAQFAYITATMGASGRDPRFEAHWHDVYEAGMGRGAIHRYSLCTLAIDQANNFNATVPRESDALPAAIDLQFAPDCPSRPDRKIVVGELQQLIALVETHTGQPAILRVSRDFEAAYKVSEALRRPLWSVQNFFPPDYAARPWRLWQATDMRRMDGATMPLHWDVVAP